MFSASIVDAAVRSCGRKVPAEAKQAAARRRSWRQKLGSGRLSSWRPWRRTIGRPQRRDSGKPSGASEGGSSTLPTLFTVHGWGAELLTSTGTLTLSGRWKKYFEDLLNPTDLPSSEEAEAGDSEVDSSITQAEVTEVVRKLLGGKAPGVDEIRPEYLKSLDVVGLSWLTRLCNIAWRLGTVPLEWQTGVVVPLFKKGDRRVCSNYRGITLLSLPGKVYARVLERRIRPIVDPRIQEEQCGFRPWSWNSWTSSIPSTGCLRVYGSLPNQSTCALWIWRRHSTVSLVVVFCGECSVSMGSGAFAKGCSVSVRPEQELGSHCRQRSQGPEGVRFGNHRISSLLFADDVVLFASSRPGPSACVLERFAAECEAAGMRISTSKSEAMALDRKRVAWPSPGEWRGPASSGGVQVSRGLVHE
ncbi:hypothetical protein L3Q82_014631 [Scortum barcoo]|uniref:Uncharacterized protein n=1 Tax=Scortum barcoo TaxID=214431 RepID=A0ACB8VXL8_9TELE|nr:hypothetical protein L3Q82_014631 [Scortum barcoo]